MINHMTLVCVLIGFLAVCLYIRLIPYCHSIFVLGTAKEKKILDFEMQFKCHILYDAFPGD